MIFQYGSVFRRPTWRIIPNHLAFSSLSDEGRILGA